MNRELSHKREGSEAALRQRLTEMRSSYFEQLDTAAAEFRAMAAALVTPKVLEAEAMARQPELEHAVGIRVVINARRAVQRPGPSPD